jgi:hypothetical protein
MLNFLLKKPRTKTYKPIVIFGVARSGTTWLSQIISTVGYELSFEPIGSMNFAEDYKVKHEPIPPFYYLEKRDKNAYKPYMDMIMSAEIRDKFVLKPDQQKYIGSNKKVIKLIRANLMIPWMQENYDFYGILIIRSPHATINSQIKYHMNEGVLNIEDFYPKVVLNNFTPKQRNIMKKVKNRKDILAVNWCIQNSIPLKKANRHNFVILKYEDLVKNPKRVIRKLSKRVGFDFTKAVREQLYKKSFTSRKETKKIQNYNPRSFWKKNFTQEEIDSIVEIVKAFNLEEYLDL